MCSPSPRVKRGAPHGSRRGLYETDHGREQLAFLAVAVTLPSLFKKLFASIWRYERGIWFIAAETSFKRIVWWKRLAWGITFVLPTGIILVTGLPGGTKVEYDINAAVAAIGAASCILIAFIPTPPSRLDHAIRISGGCFAILAGIFWLLDASEGNMLPYLAILSPILISMLITTLVLNMNQWEGIYKKRRRDLDNQSEEENSSASQ